jgi:8-oxo-dGTP diphosphatase
MKKVAKVILYKDDKVLLQLRDDKIDIQFPNMWSLFGGSIEEGESPEECAIREIKEEVNADIKNIRFIGKQKRYAYDMEIEDNIFSAEIKEEISDLTLNEGSDMRLFSMKDLQKVKIAPHYKKYIIDFLSKVKLT